MNPTSLSRSSIRFLPLLALPLGAIHPAFAAPTLATLAIPGDASFVAVAKDVLDVRFALDPSIPAGDGLFDDAARVPSFSPDAVNRNVARLNADIVALNGMKWRSWDIDRQIDWRWIYAGAEDARLQLIREKLYLHRPAAWLEPLADTYIALLTYAPERADIRERLTRGIPGMVAEMRWVAASPTQRDVKVAAGVAAGILSTLRTERPSAGRDSAAAALSGYLTALEARKDLPEFTVIGADRYEERLRRALLLPWSARQLLALAESELAETDAAIKELTPRIGPDPAPTSAQLELAKGLTQEKVLALYDGITQADRAFLDKSDLVTVPAGVGPIHARPTPEAMIPLTGDGGSMNPPPPIGDSNVGWWNVEHFKDDWTSDRRVRTVVNSQDQALTGMGPYAAHEGVPGHHLQLFHRAAQSGPVAQSSTGQHAGRGLGDVRRGDVLARRRSR